MINTPKRMGYLGPKGTFSYFAFVAYQERYSQDYEGVSMDSFIDLFEGFKAGQLDEIIVPIENSVEGCVNPSLDLLVKNPNVWIKNEICMPIQHSLMTVESTTLDNIQEIYSHAQPLAQCRHYLHEKLPKSHLHHMASTAKAAEKVVAERREGTAIIGSHFLSHLYPLTVMEDNIQDSKTNTTRFIIINKDKTKPTERDKTSLVFSTKKDQPGSLYEVLSIFANGNINLTRIASRPTKNDLGEYVFFLDFEGHAKERVIEEVLAAVQTKTSFYKLLGAYPVDNRSQERGAL